MAFRPRRYPAIRWFRLPPDRSRAPARQRGSARRRRADRCAADGCLRDGRSNGGGSGSTDAGAASRIERQVRRELAVMTDACRPSRARWRAIRSCRRAWRRTPRIGCARCSTPPRSRAIDRRATTPARRHDLRLGGRRACLGGSPVRPPPGADQRGRGPVRDAVAARAAARLRPADRRPARNARLGSVGRRARDHACARDTRSSARSRATSLMPTSLVPVSLRLRVEGAGDGRAATPSSWADLTARRWSRRPSLRRSSTPRRRSWQRGADGRRPGGARTHRSS